jgi:hypothetical protein
MSINVLRNHTGHRVGECHQRARYPDADVRRARELRAQGFTYAQIADVIDAPWLTVRDWCVYATRWSA